MLVAITAVGGILRFQAAADPSQHLSSDEQAYAKIAFALSQGGVYGQGSQDNAVHWPPGAPFLFAAAQELDPQPRAGDRWEIAAGYRAQALVGTLLMPATFLLVFLLAGTVPGLLAAGLVAVYPPLIEASSDLLSEPLGALLITCAMAVVMLALRRPVWWRLIAAGVLLGAAVLTRADLILVPAIAGVVVGAALWARERRRVGRADDAPGADGEPSSPASVPSRAGLLAGARGVALLGLGCLLLVGPWSAYASDREGHFVPVSDGGPSNLFIGTFLPGDGGLTGTKHALADQTRARFPELAGEKPFRLPMPKVLITVRERRPGLTRDDALRAAGMENLRRYALGEPVAFAGMMARKVERLWLHYTVGAFQDERAWIRVVHVGIVVLALVGLVGAAARRRGGAGLWVLGLTLLYITALNAVLVSEPRHNLAVMPLVVAAGVAGLAAALRGAPPPAALRTLRSPTAPGRGLPGPHRGPAGRSRPGSGRNAGGAGAPDRA